MIDFNGPEADSFMFEREKDDSSGHRRRRKRRTHRSAQRRPAAGKIGRVILPLIGAVIAGFVLEAIAVSLVSSYSGTAWR